MSAVESELEVDWPFEISSILLACLCGIGLELLFYSAGVR